MYKTLLLLLLLLGGCARRPYSPPAPPHYPPAQTAQNQPTLPPTTTAPLDFDDWKRQFYTRARQAGADERDLGRLLDGAHYQEKTVQSDRSQPEANPMIWQYLDKTVNQARIDQGRKLLRGQRFPIPAEYVIAIWGMESGYGQNMGKTYLPSALATLAFDGRRREFAETQLLALLKLLEEGALSWDQLNGSWAGGLGHTQFIPATFLEYGVDGDGDGRRDPFNQADALASTAHYLHASGWQPGGWGEVVQLPAHFLSRHADLLEQPLDAEALRRLGIRSRAGGKLWLPAGKNGPALLLSPNFDVIKVYNRSDNYALAISLLADGIAGRRTELSWPRQEKGLTGSEVKTLQSRLNEMGLDAGTPDGKPGAQTRRAFRAWQAQNGQIPDGFISRHNAQGLLQ